MKIIPTAIHVEFRVISAYVSYSQKGLTSQFLTGQALILSLFSHSRYSCKCFFCRCNGSVYILVRMGTAHKEGFKLGRGKVDALFEHGLEPDLEFFLVGVAGVLVIQHIFFAEENAEKRDQKEGPGCFGPHADR